MLVTKISIVSKISIDHNNDFHRKYSYNNVSTNKTFTPAVGNN